MQRIQGSRRLYSALTLLGLVSGGRLAGADTRQPVYIYLYARVTDQVNIAMSEDRLRHILPLVERYRQMRPEVHLSATVLFSGAVSEALQQRNAQTHILDFVKDYIRRGVIQAGYDGTDEPTYRQRPTLDFSVLQDYYSILPDYHSILPDYYSILPDYHSIL